MNSYFTCSTPYVKIFDNFEKKFRSADVVDDNLVLRPAFVTIQLQSL